jgi:spore maturation protein CgeB
LDVVVLGLSLSSSWGNGHATTYRALLKAFAARGHKVLFLERDVPWYSGAHRDLPDPTFCELAFYKDLAGLEVWKDRIAAADAVIVGSYVPDGVAAGRWVQHTACGITAFYDIDTPVTLAKLDRGDEEYISRDLIAGYDLYLSFTGGPVLDRLMHDYHSPAARPLYCSVDPEQYAPLATRRRWDLSYLGTFSADRQPTLERLFLVAALRAPQLRFAVAGPQYPDDITWPANVERLEHVPPADHAEFYNASRYTLNVTRADMISAGYSPSVRLFEAAACGTPIISDIWSGIESFFEPGGEIILAQHADDVLAILDDPGELARDRRSVAARQRVLAHHTSAHRAAELERYLSELRPKSGHQTPAGPQTVTPQLGAPP